MNVLHLDSSILGEASASRLLTREIVERLVAHAPGSEVTYRDLVAQPLPHFSAGTITGADCHCEGWPATAGGRFAAPVAGSGFGRS